MSRFGWAFVNDVIIGTGSAGTGSAVDGPTHAVVVKDSGIISGATNFNFNNVTGFGQLTGSLGITNNLSVTGNLSSGPFTTTTITATSYVSASSLTGTLRSNTGNKFGSAAGDVHQFTGSISAGIISGTNAQFTTVSASTVTGSTAFLQTLTNTTLNNTTIINNTITSSILLVTGATNTIISGRNIDGMTFQASSSDLTPDGLSTISSMTFKPDGSKVFLYDYGDNDIRTYDLTTPWSLSSLSNPTLLSTGVPISTTLKNTAMYFKPDGTKVYLLAGDDSNKLYQATLTVPWDMSSLISWSVAVTLTGSGGVFSAKSHQGIHISEDGNYLFSCFNDSGASNKIIRYTIVNAWDAASIVHSTYISASFTTDAIATDITLTNDGKSILIFDSDGSFQYIKEFQLENAYDLSNLTLKTNKNLASIIGYTGISQNCFYVKPDQTTIYAYTVAGGTTPKITQFNVQASEVDLVGHFNVGGDAVFSQNLQVYGDTTLQDVSSSVAQFRTLSGSLVNLTTVTGSSLSSSIGQFAQLTASSANIAGAVTIGGAVIINGGTTRVQTFSASAGLSGNIAQFGVLTSSATLLTGATSVGGNIVPSVNSIYDLGSTGSRWRNIYVSTAIDAPSISGTSVTGSIISGSTITGSNITSSNFVGNGANITNITASNIPNFTNDVRAKISAGTGISISVGGQIATSGIPNASLTNSSIMIGTTGISLGATGSIIQGINTLTGSNITGSDAKFTSLTASNATINTITSSIGLSGSQGQFSQLTASIIRSTGSSAYIGIGTGSNNTLVEISHTNGNVYRGMRMLSGSTEKWFAGASTTDTYVIRRSGSTNDITIDGNGNVTVANELTASSIRIANDLYVANNTTFGISTATNVNFVSKLTASTDAVFNGPVYNNDAVYVRYRAVSNTIGTKSLLSTDYFIRFGGSAFTFDMGVPTTSDLGRIIMFRNSNGAVFTLSASAAVIHASTGGMASTTYNLDGTAGNTGVVFISDGSVWYRISNS